MFAVPTHVTPSKFDLQEIVDYESDHEVKKTDDVKGAGK
jgi:hypothetical protein